MVILSCSGLLSVPRIESARLAHCSRPSVVTMIRRGLLPSCVLVRDGPKSYTRSGPCPRRFKLPAFATLTATSVIPLAALLEARSRMRTGGLPASELLRQHLLDPSSRERHRLTHFVLNRVPGAGAWLFALPDSPDTHIPPPLFRVSLRRRLRMPIWSQDSNCSLCGQVLDKVGDHALACGCGGDRVSRHNLIRDVVHSAANDRANLATVLEKPGLVIPRDPIDDDRLPDPDPPDLANSSRRPADVWVPRGPRGGPEAWDFSITSAFKLG